MQAGTITQSTDKKSVRGFAVILHEHDFRELICLHRAIRRLDYTAYLNILWRRMVLAKQAGQRVLVGPFLIDQHVSYADRIGALPFSPFAMRAFDAFVAQTSPHTREWRGESIDRVMANLRAAESMVPIGRAPPSRGKHPLGRRKRRSLAASGVFDVRVRPRARDAARESAGPGRQPGTRRHGARADLPSPLCRLRV